MRKMIGSKLSQKVDALVESRENIEKELATIQHEIDALKKNINILNEKFVKLP